MNVRSRSFLPALLLALTGLSAPALAADAAAGSTQVSAARAGFAAARPGVAFLNNGPGLTTLYGPAFSNGVSAQDSAARFARDNAAIFGSQYGDLSANGLNADGAHLLPVSYDAAANAYRFTLVSYSQVRDGYPVWRSDLRLLVRNEDGFPLVLAKSALKDLGAYHVAAGVREKAITEAAANQSAQEIFPALNSFEPGRLVIFAGSPDVPAAPILAWEFIASGPAGADGIPQRWLFIVDAVSGAAVYRENLVMNVNVTGNVSAWATPGYRAGVCDPATLRPLPYARVSITGGGFAYTDANGNYTITHGGTAPVTVNASPRGQFFRVFSLPGTPQTDVTTALSQSITPPGPANFVFNPGVTTEMTLAEVNAYLAANVVRDYTLAFNPAFPQVSTSSEFPVRVNLDDTCNAYYDGTSLNFFLSGGGCNNTGFGTVVHHEYGHHIVQVAGSGQGAYGEGFGDVMGVIITDESLLGRGFQSCSGGLRNANNSCQYSATTCSSCGTEIHACGQLISGCVWSVRTSLLASNPSSYRQLISDMAINSVLLHQGTSIANDIVIDFLTINDDDDDISNGTPNYTQIASGFQAHGLTAPVLPALGFAYPSGRPQLISPAGGTSMIVEVSGITETPQTNTGSLVYDAGAGFVTVPMTQLSPNVYRADFPAIPCGTVVRYYVTARTTLHTVVNNPLTAPADLRTTVSATGTQSVFADDMETNRGWTMTATGDNAVSGIWVRVNPIGAYVNGVASQPEDDVTTDPGAICFVTGNATAGAAAGTQDVDTGTTSLTTPVFSLAGATAPAISYWRWYSNNLGAAPNADTFNVLISNNGGTSWVTAEVVGPSGPETEGGWYFHQLIVSDFVTPSANMRMRFVASDLADGSLIEAAVDEFNVSTYLCTSPCPGDFNEDGQQTVPDIFAYLSAWFALDPRADIDGVPGITVPDIFFFLSAWFTPCP